MSQNGRKMAKIVHNAAKKFDWDSSYCSPFSYCYKNKVIITKIVNQIDLVFIEKLLNLFCVCI